MSELDALDPAPMSLYAGPTLDFTCGCIGPRPFTASDFRRYFFTLWLTRHPIPYGPPRAFVNGSRFGDFGVVEPERGSGAD